MPRPPLLALLALSILGGCSARPDWALSAPQIYGSPLRVADRVYVLTGQYNRRINHMPDSFSARQEDVDLFTDLWAFDARTAAPLWRKRLETVRNGSLAGRALLGADGGVLWLLLPGGITAVTQATGNIQAGAAEIEARNPGLRGLLPHEPAFVRFGAKGLQVMAADGRDWRIDPATLAAQDAAAAPVSSSAVAPPRESADARAFLERGLSMPGRWLGLLTEEEASRLRTNVEPGDLDRHSRRRLWGARVKTAEAVLAMRDRYTELAPLGEEFLAPGLLSVNRRPLLLRHPDSVLVLHQDRLGDARRLQLARVAGPAGNVVWKAALPVSELLAVLPDDGHTLWLHGALFLNQPAEAPADPWRGAHRLLVAVDLASGKVHSFNMSDHTAAPAAVTALQTQSPAQTNPNPPSADRSP